MEVPEKIYCDSDGHGNIVRAHNIKWPDGEAENIEYTRTDAFIEKAVAWLKENAANFVSKDNKGEPYLYRIGLADEFIKAMML